MKQDHDIEIGLLQKEKCQLDVCVTSLTQERFTLESECEKRQNKILKLEDQLSVLQCKLKELRKQYEKLASDYIDKFSIFTNKHEEEIEHMKKDFWKEKEELLMENKMYKACISKMETKTNQLEETNCSLMKDLKDLQIYHKEVGVLHIYNYIFIFCFLFMCVCMCTCRYMYMLLDHLEEFRETSLKILHRTIFK